MDYSICKLGNGKVYRYSPHFIFIHNTDLRSLLNDLNALGLEKIEQIGVKPNRENRFEFAVLQSNFWIIICDNWYYSLLNNGISQRLLKKLGRKHDLYSCWVGDTDYSYGFSYYKSGNIVRDFLVSNHSYKKEETIIEKNYGDELPNEAICLGKNGEYEKVISIAYELGLSFPIGNEDIKIFRYQITE